MTSIFTPSASFIRITLSLYSLYRFVRSFRSNAFYPTVSTTIPFTHLYFSRDRPKSIIRLYSLSRNNDGTSSLFALQSIDPYFSATVLFCAHGDHFLYGKKVVSRKSQTVTRTIFKLELRYSRFFHFSIDSSSFPLFSSFFYVKFLDISLFPRHFPFVYRFSILRWIQNPNTNTSLLSLSDIFYWNEFRIVIIESRSIDESKRNTGSSVSEFEKFDYRAVTRCYTKLPRVQLRSNGNATHTPNIEDRSRYLAPQLSPSLLYIFSTFQWRMIRRNDVSLWRGIEQIEQGDERRKSIIKMSFFFSFHYFRLIIFRIVTRIRGQFRQRIPIIRTRSVEYLSQRRNHSLDIIRQNLDE